MLIDLGGKRSLAALEAQSTLGFKGTAHISADAFISHLRTQMKGVPKFETLL